MLSEIIADSDRQLVNQDAEAGKCGPAEQVGRAGHERIPDDTRELLNPDDDERSAAFAATIFEIVVKSMPSREET